MICENEECFHYCYLFKINFSYKPLACNGCHDLLLKKSLKNIAVVTVGRNIYRIDFWSMTKSEVLNRMKNANLSEKSGQL